MAGMAGAEQKNRNGDLAACQFNVELFLRICVGWERDCVFHASMSISLLIWSLNKWIIFFRDVTKTDIF
jgi:hypothetical protein